MSITTDLVDDALGVSLPGDHAHLYRIRGLMIPRIKPMAVDCKHFVDQTIREGYVDKMSLISELISAGERLEDYRSRVYYQGEYNPEAVQREEESMQVYPQARHDYGFDDLYADSEAVHDYFERARKRNDAQRARDQRARDQTSDAQQASSDNQSATPEVQNETH